MRERRRGARAVSQVAGTAGVEPTDTRGRLLLSAGRHSADWRLGLATGGTGGLGRRHSARPPTAHSAVMGRVSGALSSLYSLYAICLGWGPPHLPRPRLETDLDQSARLEGAGQAQGASDEATHSIVHNTIYTWVLGLAFE